jgi:hypothetical protein
MKLRPLLISALALAFSPAFSQKMDSAARHKAAKADVLQQKNTISDKGEVKNPEPKKEVKQQKRKTTLVKKKHKRHKWKRKMHIMKK